MTSFDHAGSPPSTLSAFRPVPRTGVIFVMEEALARGYRADDPGWCNLGQGQPETGELPGGSPRPSELSLRSEDLEYAPVAGLWELREAVAEYYNRTYRRGLPSRYTAENVAISGGGRTSLTRAAASLGQVNLGHFLPDYTAYEELLEVFRPFLPIPILRPRRHGYALSADELRREVRGLGLSAVLLSNPCNPTGQLLWGDELAAWIAAARELDCTLLLDEFYSHYIWRREAGVPVSAAAWVEDVDRDPVVLFDGLTKNWRYPGWRVTWTVGPRSVIEAVASAGSFLDGGAARPLQRAAIPLLEPSRVEAEIAAIQARFRPKRQLMLDRLRQIGLGIDLEPEGTFYVFASIEGLPQPLDDCMSFFGAALTHQIITVPGIFFDVNPGQRRAPHLTRFRHHVRFSFGAEPESLACGLDRLERMIESTRRGRLPEVLAAHRSRTSRR
jgi:N-succinyldiaminopimelate aminotransferase